LDFIHCVVGTRSNVASPQTIAAVHCLAPEAGVTRIDETSDLWWKNAIVYCVDVKTFLDYDRGWLW